jgi:uncharacterized protein
MAIFEVASEMPCAAEELYAYHARPGALSRLTPPFERVRGIVEARLEEGAQASLELAVGPVWTRWKARHEEVRPGRGFVDVMVEGPFRAWRHEHLFEPAGERSVLVDRVTFEPAGGLGASLVLDKLARSFRYRHQTVLDDLRLFRALPSRPLRIGITGITGLIGREVSALLRVAGHTVRRFARTDAADTIRWDPGTGALGAGAEDLDAVIHLAAEPIGERRLNPEQQWLVRESRVDGTARLARTLRSLARPPRVFISAAGVGIYGSRADDVLEDDAGPGAGFLAEVCDDWERAALTAASPDIRVVTPRMGVVLSPQGGALERMLLPFRAGLGARIGDGRQWMSIVSVDEVAAMFYRALVDERVVGAFNAVGPEPLRNERFTHLLGKVLERPAPFVVPRFAARALFGGALVDETLLVSQRAVPARLFSWGHAFRHPTTEDALRHVLGRHPSDPAGRRDTRPSSSPPPPSP